MRTEAMQRAREAMKRGTSWRVGTRWWGGASGSGASGLVGEILLSWGEWEEDGK